MTIPLKGGAALSEFLLAFPERLQKGALRAGAVAAARPVRDQARANARRQSGKMAKAIKSGSPKVKDGTVSIKIRLKGPHSFLGIFEEYGVAQHFIQAGDSGISARLTTRLGNRAGIEEGEGGVLKIGNKFVSGAVLHPGYAAHPFLRPALDAKADEAIKAYGDRVRSYLSDKTGFTAPSFELGEDE